MAQSIQAEPGAKRSGKRFGCAFIVLSTMAVLGLVAGLSYFIWYANARGELDSQLALIEERHEPLWFHELAGEEIDPAQDGTVLFMQAIAKVQAPTQAFTNLVFSDPPGPPTDDPLVVAELERNREVLNLLAAAVRKPNFRLPLDYRTNQPFNILLDSVQKARDLARLVAGDISVALAAGDAERAIESTMLMYDLSELLRNEPIIISQLVRTAIASMAQASLEQVVARVDLTPDQFAALDDRLARMQQEFTLVPAMLGERSSTFTTLQNLADNPDLLADAGEMSPWVRFWTSKALLIPNRLSDQAYYLSVMRHVVDTIDQPGLEGAASMSQIEQEIKNAPRSFVISQLLLPAMVNIHRAGMRHRENLIAARLGLRIDHYYAVHGTFPESLDAIVDDRLPAVPVDLFTGKPRVYRVLPDGFVIYNLGTNGIDDGGGEKPDLIEFHTNFEVHYPALMKDIENKPDP